MAFRNELDGIIAAVAHAELMIFGGLIVLTKGSAIAPFVYTLF